MGSTQWRSSRTPQSHIEGAASKLKSDPGQDQRIRKGRIIIRIARVTVRVRVRVSTLVVRVREKGHAQGRILVREPLGGGHWQGHWGLARHRHWNPGTATGGYRKLLKATGGCSGYGGSRQPGSVPRMTGMDVAR